jgi:hypothetical protein
MPVSSVAPQATPLSKNAIKPKQQAKRVTFINSLLQIGIPAVFHKDTS